MAKACELFFWIRVRDSARKPRMISQTIIWRLADEPRAAALAHMSASLAQHAARPGSAKSSLVVEAHSLDDHPYTLAEAQAWIDTPGGRDFSDGALVCSLHSVVIDDSGNAPVKPVGKR